MFAGVMDRVRVALGRSTEWERRTKAAWMEAIQLVSDARGRDEFLEATAVRYEPAIVHAPTRWLLTFPHRDRSNHLRWLRTQKGRFTLVAGATRSGVRLETYIAEAGPFSLAEEFELRVQASANAGPDVQTLDRTPPGDDPDTPGVLTFAFTRNGAPQVARMLILGVNGHVVEVTYDTPARLAQTAAALADEAFARGLEHVRDPQLGRVEPDDLGEMDPDAFIEAMRGFGMSEEEIARALKEQEITQP